MNIPFPCLTPNLVDPRWFHSDQPIDEDAELTKLEMEHQAKMNRIATQCVKGLSKVLLPRQVPIEEAETDVEVNEETTESETTNDEDDEEAAPSLSLPRGANNPAPEPMDNLSDEADDSNHDALWIGLPQLID